MTTLLNRSLLNEAERQATDAATQSPVTVLQIGEGNFLRGFFDWMVHRSKEQGLFEGSIALTQPRPKGRAKIEAIAAQDGLYTLVTRGIENGERVSVKETIGVFSAVFDPYSDWGRLAAIAESASLRFVVSNTTEAGLVYQAEPLIEGAPIQSFPGKIAWLLHRRYLSLGGTPESGLIFLPCELLERNGDELRRCVLRYCEDWALPDAFQQWVVEHNRFLNSLVDRIVTGYPDQEQAESWFAEWSYEDRLLDTAEPYHLWAIEAEPELEKELPFRQAGCNVHFVPDLLPYQQRKVRVLNAAHTLMTPLALLRGFDYVREVMEHPRFGAFVREAVEQEIMPTIPLPQEELRAYAGTVFERFLNPFINHRLHDIAMNSLSKFKARLLPSLLAYAERGEEVPARLVEAFAGLLRYYRITRVDDGFVGSTLGGRTYEVRDDAASLEKIAAIWSSADQRPLNETVAQLLALTEIWGCDLTQAGGLGSQVAASMQVLEGEIAR
ncbi:tagaturonate reductase [Paenibacillus silvisoli]|uniref:tagaturonate reductase n=1 Tax=Paenibacillus silvisoli TaxID=3110539 RepID=UPI002803E4E3|nr:tagaturonate reductase [Paenibacillus silvisoli]